MPLNQSGEETRPKWWLLKILFALLALIVIFGFVAPMGFFGTTGHNHRHSHTEHTALQLRQSIASFFTEYSRYPSQETPTAPEAIHYTDGSLMNVLMGTEFNDLGQPLNPRNITFYSGRKAKGNRGGVVIHPDSTYDLFDAWGNHYRVIMDTNRDDQITPPAWTGLKDPIRKSVIVWSPGPDGKDETAKDNITSW